MSRRLFADLAPAILAQNNFYATGHDFDIGPAIGPLTMKGAGELLLLLSLILSGWSPRIAALSGVFGAGLCIPAFACGSVSGTCHRAFGSGYAPLDTRSYAFDPYGILGLLALTLALRTAIACLVRTDKG